MNNTIYKYPLEITDEPNMYFRLIDNTVEIEIKQNKEVMEEKKQKLDDLVGLYSSGKITYKELDKELKALYDKEESEPTLKEFDIEAAKQGKPVCTRDGKKARIICFDRKGKQPIIALVTQDNGEEFIENYHLNGIFNVDDTFENNNDLMMLSEKKEGWVNIYKSLDCRFEGHVSVDIYKTKEQALKEADNTVLDTVKIEWEE